MYCNTCRLLCGIFYLGLLAGTSRAAVINNGDAVGGNYTIQGIDAGITVDFTAHAPAAGNTAIASKFSG